MPDAELLSILSETLRELTEEQKQRESRVSRCHAEIVRLSECLQATEEQVRIANYEDNQIVDKQKRLIDLVNRSSEKSPALLQKIDKLREEQHQTFSQRQAATESEQTARGNLQRAKTTLAIAEQDRQATQKKWQEVADHIQRENSK